MFAVAGPERDALVGRDDALARIVDAIDAARAGAGRAVLVTGVSGVGKTALLRAAVSAAHDVDLGWGTCVEGGSTPGYWAWTQALNGLVRRVGPERAAATAGADRGLLATIVPALGSPDVAEESERSRMLLLDAVVAWVHALGSARPVVLLLDDLQWADESSLRLLELFVQDPRPASVTVLAAFRADEAPGPLQARLAALVARSHRLHLAGVDRAASRRLVEAVAGRPVAEDVVDEIYRRAGGHPFFTTELARVATAELPDAQVPAAVRDAVDRRVRALSPATQQVLRAAALVGAAVRADVLVAVTGLSPAEVAAAIAEAVSAEMLRAEPDHVRFAHDLFRETIVELVAPDARAGLHLAVADALERRAGPDAGVTAAELARHFRAALPLAGIDRAVVWALRAAEVDRASLALVEAPGHLRQLRRAVADAGLTLSDRHLVDVLLAEADALARIGRASDARGLVRVARQAADRSGDAELTTRAALAVANLGSRFASRRDEVIDELESALVAVGDRDPVLESRLSAALARELQHSVPEQRARAGPLTERALRLGRAADDPEVLVACLLARHDVLWTPGEAPRRADVAAELVTLARRSGDRERLAEALLLRANALLECGSAAFEPALEACLEVLADLGQPRHLYTLETRRACLALLRGRLDEAARRIDHAVELGRRLREPDTDNVRMSQQLELARARGHPDELRSFADEAVAHWTGAPVHAHAVAAGFCARAGDIAAARHHVAAVRDLGTWRADRSYLWSVFVRELAVAAAAIDDRELCAELLAELRPLAGSCGVNGAAVAFAGCHSETAGRLAAALGDSALARELLTEACAVYERLGAATVVEARRELDAAADRSSSATAALVRRGAVWDVRYGGRSASVGHCKGLSDIARLVRRPGQDVHVLELVGFTADGGPRGEVLDRAAVTAYRRRLAEISARLTAEHEDDRVRRRLEEEHAAITAELRRSTGLGGRARTFGNHPAERARKAVTARIRDAVRRLEPPLPELAAHLDSTLVTGVRCRYRGDLAWVVQE